MSTTNQFDGLTAGLHFRGYPEVDPNIYNNALIVRALGDFGASPDDESKWLVREINAKDPIMIKASRSYSTASAQRAKLSQLLANLAQAIQRDFK